MLLVAVAAGLVPAPARSLALPQNIVLILTDDQRWDSLQYMPKVESLLVAHGVTFANAFDNNPVCCPTRTTIMTGLTSGHNGVWGNRDDGGFDGFVANGDENRQVFGWLHADGYQTALIGKFLNGYRGGGPGSDIAWTMPGVDDWQAFLIDDVSSDLGGCRPEGYFATCYSNNGAFQPEPSSAYSTITSGRKAVSFITKADPSRPLFLYYAPRAPHLPTTPSPAFANACGSVPTIRGAAYNKAITQGPAYMTSLPAWSAGLKAKWDRNWIDDCRTLLSVDAQVGRIVEALQEAGRLRNTLFVYASDNGFAFGEHRWHSKIVPYEPSLRVPIVVRDDAMIPAAMQGTTVDDQVTSLDYTPTFLQAAQLSMTLDGQSLFPLFTGSGSWVPQDSVLIEHGGNGGEKLSGTHIGVPAYCGVRNANYMYAQYATGEEELYDLTADPNELTNVAGDPDYAAVLTQLRNQTHQLCDPTPPGFTWSH